MLKIFAEIITIVLCLFPTIFFFSFGNLLYGTAVTTIAIYMMFMLDIIVLLIHLTIWIKYDIIEVYSVNHTYLFDNNMKMYCDSYFFLSVTYISTIFYHLAILTFIVKLEDITIYLIVVFAFAYKFGHIVYKYISLRNIFKL